MPSPVPRVTIGLPVYNGEQHLPLALESLLAQVGAVFEIVVSDNASTDGTERVCREFAARDRRIVYSRNSRNIGIFPNFARTLELARGQYFCWAAHDDLWSPEFVSRLLHCLELNPQAVAATPTLMQIDGDGHFLHAMVMRPAQAGRGLPNLQRFCREQAVGWFYSLWRIEFLREHISEMLSWPAWGGDCVWLSRVALGFTLAGDDRAIVYKRARHSPYSPKTAAGKLHFLAYMFRYMTQISLAHDGSTRERLRALNITWRFIYRNWMRRSSLVSTAWYLARLVVTAGVSTGISSSGKLFGGSSPVVDIAENAAEPIACESQKRAA